MFNFFNSLFRDKKEKKDDNSLSKLLSELIGTSNGLGEYNPLDMTDKEKASKGSEMLSKIKYIELQGNKFNDDEFFYLLALSYRNYAAWYVKGGEKKKYLKTCLSILKKVSKRHSEGRGTLGRLLIELKDIGDLPKGIKILEELNKQNRLPLYLNSLLAKVHRQSGNIKVEDNYSLCKFKNDPSPAVFREERKRFRALIRQCKKDKKIEELKKVLNNYYSLGVLVTLCYGDHNCNSAVSGKSYNDAIGIVQNYCSKINDSYEKSSRLKNSEFISNNDWKTFEKIFTVQ